MELWEATEPRAQGPGLPVLPAAEISAHVLPDWAQHGGSHPEWVCPSRTFQISRSASRVLGPMPTVPGSQKSVFTSDSKA